MIPKSLSASALQTASLCLSRFAAEHVHHGRAPGNEASKFGTTVHEALEVYVKNVHLNKTHEPSVAYLVSCFEASYMKHYMTTDFSSDEFSEGVDLLKAWFKRTDFTDIEVVTVEVKKSYPVKTSVGEIPFNYIIDRLDKDGPNSYRVVDYKTNRFGYKPEDLRNLPQARIYAMMTKIEYPDAERITVEFDMLRHGGPVGVIFSRDDLIEVWKWIKGEAERIIETDENNAPETINTYCGFCAKKATCNALVNSVSAGSVLSFNSAIEAVDRRAELAMAGKAIRAALQEIDTFVMAQALKTETLEWEGEHNRMLISSGRKTRKLDTVRAATALGEDFMRSIGKTSVTMAQVDALLKGDEISEDKKRILRSLIYTTEGDPYVTTKPKSVFVED